MPAPVNPSFAIRGFEVLGDNPLDSSVTTTTLAPFLRVDATLEVLQKAIDALEGALRERGFSLHRAVLPPQAVGDTVKLQIVRFTMGKIEVAGNERHFPTDNIRRSLPELRENETPNFRVLARQTAIANENASKQVTVALRESDEPEKVDATVNVRESRPWSFATSWSNVGTPATGVDRLTFFGSHSNVFGLDHTFTGAFTTSAATGSRVRQLGLSYRVPFYAMGGVLGLTYTQSSVNGNFGAFSSTGAGSTFGLNYSHYFVPNGGYRSYLTVALDDKRFDSPIINGIPSGLPMTRSRPITVSYVGRRETDTSVFAYNTDLAFNTGSGSGNNLAAFTANGNNTRVSTAAWQVLRVGANYSTVTQGKWLLNARLLGQLASTALIAGEQFGLGGSQSVRGSEERAIAGDHGVFSSVEVSTPEISDGLRVVGFMDAGWLANVRAGGPTQPSNDRLAGMGLGLRLNLPSGFSLTADAARILVGSRVPVTANALSPQAGSGKIHVTLSFRF
jgi:hemolysin activation/secretion protein